MAERIVGSKRKHMAAVGSKSSDYRRKKTSVACQVCRARRTRCGAQRPCSFCVKIGAICTEEPENVESSSPRAGDTAEILQTLQELRSQVQTVSETIQGLAVGGLHRSTSSLGSPTNAKSSFDHFSILPGNVEEVLGTRAFAPFNPPQLPAILDTTTANISPSENNLSLGLTEELDSASCRAYVDYYFSRVHIKNPVLVEEEVRKCYRSVCINGIAWDANSCLVLLVLAIGAISTNGFGTAMVNDSDHAHAAMAFFSAAQKRIGLLMTESPLTKARCWFLCGVYFMTILQPVTAWQTFLQALAACRALSSVVMLRQDAPGPDTAAEESIYWSCWKSERELRYELDIPNTLLSGKANIDHPLLYPSPPAEYTDNGIQAWYFYLGEISLWRQEMDIRAKMQEFSTGYHRDMRQLAKLCLQASESLDSWQDSLPPSLQLGDVGNTDVLRFVLKGRLSYLYELITWPFLNARLHSLQVPDIAQELVLLGLNAHYERLVNNRLGFEYRHHGTWLMQRSSARSACILLLVAHDPHLHTMLPMDWRLAVEATLNMLDFWQPKFVQNGVLTRFMRDMINSVTT